MTSPTLFYTERVPAQFNRVLEEQERRSEQAEASEEERRLLHEMRDVHATLRVVVQGDGGGDFYLNVGEGRMSSDPAPEHPPFLTLVQDLAAFEALERESGDSALGFLGGLAGGNGELKLTRTRVEQLQQLDGTLRFELKGEQSFSLRAHFGQKEIPAEPNATIRIDADAYAQIRSGTLSPPQAFMSGAVELEGDMQLAMQVALALMSPDS